MRSKWSTIPSGNRRSFCGAEPGLRPKSRGSPACSFPCRTRTSLRSPAPSPSHRKPPDDSRRTTGMKGLVLTAEWDPRPGYDVTPVERETRKAVTGSSVWRRPRAEVLDVTEPALGANDVLIRPRACGVCGSDVHFYETDGQGYMLYPGLTKFPVVIGHEF